MAQKAFILCFLLFSCLFWLSCGEIPVNVPNITAGAIKGVLKGDGILVPNKGYGGVSLIFIKMDH